MYSSTLAGLSRSWYCIVEWSQSLLDLRLIGVVRLVECLSSPRFVPFAKYFLQLDRKVVVSDHMMCVFVCRCNWSIGSSCVASVTAMMCMNLWSRCNRLRDPWGWQSQTRACMNWTRTESLTTSQPFAVPWSTSTLVLWPWPQSHWLW